VTGRESSPESRASVAMRASLDIFDKVVGGGVIRCVQDRLVSFVHVCTFPNFHTHKSEASVIFKRQVRVLLGN
jgi:hypothetical protein